MPEIIINIPTKEQIEERAYQIYLERGCQDGDDLADWLTAERELRELAQNQLDEAGSQLQAVVETSEVILDDPNRAEVERFLNDMRERGRAMVAGAGS